jgi:hypothetical protein
MNLFDHLYHGCHLYLVWYNHFGAFSGCAVSNLEVTFFKYWWNKILKNMATNYIVLGSFFANCILLDMNEPLGLVNHTGGLLLLKIKLLQLLL